MNLLKYKYLNICIDFLDSNSLLAAASQTLIYYSSVTRLRTRAILANVIDLRLRSSLRSYRPSARSEAKEIRGLCAISQKVGRDRLSNASGWSARVARTPLITPTGCLPRRKSRLYVCKCCMYAMRVGTLWCRGIVGVGPTRLGGARYSRTPRSVRVPFYLSLSLTCLTSQHLLLPPPFSYVRLSFPLLSQCLSFSLFRSSVSFFFSLVFCRPRSLHIWKVEVWSTPERVFVVRRRELMRKTFYVLDFIGEMIPR